MRARRAAAASDLSWNVTCPKTSSLRQTVHEIVQAVSPEQVVMPPNKGADLSEARSCRRVATQPPEPSPQRTVETAPLPPKRWREVARGHGGRPTATCGGRGLLADVFWPGSNRIPTVFDHGFTGFRAPVLGMPISGNRAWSLSIERTFCGEHRAAE